LAKEGCEKINMIQQKALKDAYKSEEQWITNIYYH
jgi:hypothetical protein